MAIDTFLKLDPKVEGESKDERHKGEIEILRWNFDLSNKPSTLQGGGAGTGKSVPGEFQFDKSLDKSTPVLAQVTAAGDHFNSAIITVRKAGERSRGRPEGISDHHPHRCVHLEIRCRWGGGAKGELVYDLHQNGRGLQRAESGRLAHGIGQAGVRLEKDGKSVTTTWTRA